MFSIPDSIVWIGAHDRDRNDVHYWLDDTDVEDSYTNWGYLQPGDSNFNWVCLLNWDSSYYSRWQWADVIDAHYESYFFCEADFSF